MDSWISLVEKFGWNSMSISGGINRKASAFISGNEWKEHFDYVPTQIQNTVQTIIIHH